MIVDRPVALLLALRSRPILAHSLTWTAAAAVVAATTTWPVVFGRSMYLMAMVAVVFSAGLTALANTLALSLFVGANAFLLDLRQGASSTDIGIRLAVFLVMVGVTAIGADALRRAYQRSASTQSHLAKSEALTHTLLEMGPDAIVVIDPAGVVTQFSRGAEALFGWTAAEVVGRNIALLMPESHQCEDDGHIERDQTIGEARAIGRSREVVGQRRDGVQFPMLLHFGEVRVGSERYFTGFVRDLTALHEANDRARAVQAELSHLWSMTSLGEMAAVLAHELNQPLSAIANYARAGQKILLADAQPDDNLVLALDRVAEQAIRAGEIIRRMRALVTSNLKDRTAQSVSDLIIEIDFMIGLLVKEAGATVSYDLAPGFDQMLVDRIQIQQVVINLVRNAAESVRLSENKQILISTEIDTTDLIVRVEDSGAGLDSDAIGRLFNPMKSEKAAGLGLGLSISRGIIHGHSGSIWAEGSSLGGAAFCFRLPVLTAPAGRRTE